MGAESSNSRSKGIAWIAILCRIVLALSASCAIAAAQTPNTGWPAYGGDPGGTRYSAATEITPANVTTLRPAWIFHTHALDHPRPDSADASFETTPILLGTRLFLTSPFDEVFALDAATGAKLWSYEPHVKPQAEGIVITSRGVAAWTDASIPPSSNPPCANEILFGTLDARLIALDATTGKPCDRFGTHGEVDLRQGVAYDQRVGYEVTSPPTVIGNVVVVGSAVGDNQQVDPESGLVRGFDAATGKLLWSYEPLPWAASTHPRTGAGNVWSIISADPKTGLVFLPTSSPSADFYGVFRPGDNRDANSIVALDAATGRRVWAFQTVHHDLWDYDIPSEPLLFDYRGVPAIAVTTKLGQVFFLDRQTGQPLNSVVEHAVPVSAIPGEKTSPTEPLTAITLSPMAFPGIDSGPWHRDERNAAYCAKQLGDLRYQGLFTPPGEDAILLFPSNVGGVNWGGATFDPATGMLYANVNREVYSLQLHKRYGYHALRLAYEPFFRDWPFWVVSGAVLILINVLLRVRRSRRPPVMRMGMRVDRPIVHPWRPSRAGFLLGMAVAAVAGFMCLFPMPPYVAHFGHEVSPQRGSPYVLEREPIVDHNGMPCIAPPWGATVALNVNTGSIAWQAPLGTLIPGEHTGSPAFGGPISTASGLIFTASTDDAKLRALDAATGHELWAGDLPASARATPMTYTLNGRQYIVVAAGGHLGVPGKHGDSVVAFALP